MQVNESSSAMQQKMVDYLAFMNMNFVHGYKKNQSLKITDFFLNKILTTFDFKFTSTKI